MSKPWTKDEEDRGLEMARKGQNSFEIGRALGRSALAVDKRLGPIWRKERRQQRKLMRGRR